MIKGFEGDMLHGCAFSRADARGVRLFCAGGAGLKTAVMGRRQSDCPNIVIFSPFFRPIPLPD
jgi:hypothetical protein